MVLMCRTTKKLWGSGKKVITESGFCVLKILIGMFARGVYGSSLVKNCRYWPAGIYGYEINPRFEEKRNR